jgi:hypothetical protein
MPKKHNNRSLLSSMPFVSLAIVTTLLLAIRRHLPKFAANNTMDSLVERSVSFFLELKEYILRANILIVSTAVAAILGAFSFVEAQSRKNNKDKTRSVTGSSATTLSHQDVLTQINETLLSLLISSKDQAVTCSLEKQIGKLIKILIQKCGKKRNSYSKKFQNDDASSQSTSRIPGSSMKMKRLEKTADDDSYDDNLEIVCLRAAYMVLKNYPSNDEITSSSFSLLALIAKEGFVRNNILDATVAGKEDCAPILNKNTKADNFSHANTTSINSYNEPQRLIVPTYSVTIPIRVMKESLRRAKQRARQKPPPVVQEEQLSAELQRKGCLFLGVLADQTTSSKCTAKAIVDSGGLDAIFDSMEWFRYHQEVANWGLWAIFNVIYHYPSHNKIDLFFPYCPTISSMNGLERICRVMNDNSM